METILVVEDSRLLKMAIKRTLSEAGYQVADAGNGEEALKLARHTHPELIILDLMLPKIGGEQVLRELKSDPETAPIPVLVMSSLPQSNAVKLKQEGAIAYIEKSKLDLDRSEDLVRVVKAALLQAAQTCVVRN